MHEKNKRNLAISALSTIGSEVDIDNNASPYTAIILDTNMNCVKKPKFFHHEISFESLTRLLQRIRNTSDPWYRSTARKNFVEKS